MGAGAVPVQGVALKLTPVLQVACTSAQLPSKGLDVLSLHLTWG